MRRPGLLSIFSCLLASSANHAPCRLMILIMTTSMRTAIQNVVTALPTQNFTQDDDRRSQNTHSGDAEGVEKRTDQAIDMKCTYRF